MIESGVAKFHMGAAGARPYYADAEKHIEDDGEADAAIQQAIDRILGWMTIRGCRVMRQARYRTGG